MKRTHEKQQSNGQEYLKIDTKRDIEVRKWWPDNPSAHAARGRADGDESVLIDYQDKIQRLLSCWTLGRPSGEEYNARPFY